MLEVVGEGLGMVCIHVLDDSSFGSFVFGGLVCHCALWF